jgi:hypothetical protein
MTEEIVIKEGLRGGSSLHTRNKSNLLRELAKRKMNRKINNGNYNDIYRVLEKDAKKGKLKSYINSRAIKKKTLKRLCDDGLRVRIYKPTTLWKKIIVSTKNILSSICGRGILLKIDWKDELVDSIAEEIKKII